MSLKSLLAYLVGNRNAILQIAATPGALGLGAMFVFSAAFAREYDGEDLTREPWRLLLPMGASIATSFFLFCLVVVRTRMAGNRLRGFWQEYRVFLTLYWLTAPLAWLYAIPVERFFSAVDAARFNLGFLAIVSMWRVLLDCAVVEVRFALSKIAAFMVVMLFADTLVQVVLTMTPLPILNIMGGIHMSDRERLIRGAATDVLLCGFLSWPIWFLGTLLSRFAAISDETQPPEFANGLVSRPLWFVGLASILFWFAVLPFVQPEQRLRWKVEHEFEHVSIASAIDLMSQHHQQDFPPHWEPPPYLAYPFPTPPLLEIMRTIADRGAAPWVQSIYFGKLQAKLDGGYRSESFLRDEKYHKDSQILGVLGRTQEGLAFVLRNSRRFEEMQHDQLQYGSKDIANQVSELLLKAQRSSLQSSSGGHAGRAFNRPRFESRALKANQITN